MIEIRAGDIDSPEVRTLLHLPHVGAAARPLAEAALVLDLPGLRHPDTAFHTAWEAGDLLGCGALKRLDAHHGVIKGMRTHPHRSRRGVEAALLSHLLGVGREKGMQRIILDTAAAPGHDAALAVYRQFGFTPCTCAPDPRHQRRYLARVL